MENLSEKYLKLLSEYDDLRKELDSYKQSPPPVQPTQEVENSSCEQELRNCSNSHKSLYEKKEFLKKEIKNLYGMWIPPRVQSFFSTIIPWIKKGFKISESADYRFEICKKCDYFTERKNCQICGCFMEGKTKVPQAACPIGKWKAEKVKKSSEPKST